MGLKDISPKAEPIVWANIAGLIVAALIEYGLNIRSSTQELLIIVLGFVLPNIAARFSVFAPDTVEREYVRKDEVLYAKDLTDPRLGINRK